MKVIFDVEANGLKNVTEVWLVVCKDTDTQQLYIFRNLTSDTKEKERFLEFAKGVELWIGHNILGYDYPVLNSLIGFTLDIPKDTLDTLIISKLVDYSRKEGHSLEAYGEEFLYTKGTNTSKDFFKAYSKELEDYCIRDVEITYKIYLRYLRIIEDKDWKSSIELEHKFQLLVNSLENNGFSFNTDKATKLLAKVSKELEDLDKSILEAFPPKLKLIREVTPKATKYNTISLSSIPKKLRDSIVDMTVDAPFSYCEWTAFNPSSHKQIIEVLNKSGWSPFEKTQTHIDTERDIQRLKYNNKRTPELDLALEASILKLQSLRVSGWKVNENNLATLPPSSPAPARLLAKRILLESRRRTLTEWLSLVQDDGRIRGRFYAIGAWTHRMAHQNPNTANIPSEFKEDGSPKLLGREMRSLWQAPRKRLLVGVDAEGIQLRIFAHYIEDKEFTEALVKGKKSDGSDPHSLNKRILGDACRTRQAAKRFIYALLLGAGIGKLAQILAVPEDEARGALDRLLERYQGFRALKENVIPHDAKLGWFRGVDGRRVPIPGETVGTRKHLCMSGYLQSGEVIVMKRAAVLFDEDKEIIELRKEHPILFVDMVHDEDQYEVPNNMQIALKVAQTQADCITKAGEYYGLKCPLAGSFYNEDHQDYTIGVNWYSTH